MGYRIDKTSGVATGEMNQTIYMVTRGDHINSGCCASPAASHPKKHARLIYTYLFYARLFVYSHLNNRQNCCTLQALTMGTLRPITMTMGRVQCRHCTLAIARAGDTARVKDLGSWQTSRMACGRGSTKPQLRHRWTTRTFPSCAHQNCR